MAKEENTAQQPLDSEKASKSIKSQKNDPFSKLDDISAKSEKLLAAILTNNFKNSSEKTNQQDEETTVKDVENNNELNQYVNRFLDIQENINNVKNPKKNKTSHTGKAINPVEEQEKELSENEKQVNSTRPSLFRLDAIAAALDQLLDDLFEYFEKKSKNTQKIKEKPKVVKGIIEEPKPENTLQKNHNQGIEHILTLINTLKQEVTSLKEQISKIEVQKRASDLVLGSDEDTNNEQQISEIAKNLGNGDSKLTKVAESAAKKTKAQEKGKNIDFTKFIKVQNRRVKAVEKNTRNMEKIKNGKKVKPNINDKYKGPKLKRA
ncbi:hypothetical protein [Aquimarina sp. MMG016]|uniref:hypothetical protein n=1 Tax=Aquimarina sp. MMG016 TaxID=2822690 RepID=UPI001B3A1EEF|nr:hypothetical protein [Aquimarina sp. MMG016]MBQ4820582.1 hypothetical protein [Aquimarina sp. MMG016]